MGKNLTQLQIEALKNEVAKREGILLSDAEVFDYLQDIQDAHNGDESIRFNRYTDEMEVVGPYKPWSFMDAVNHFLNPVEAVVFS